MVFAHQLGRKLVTFWGRGERPFWGDEGSPEVVNRTDVESERLLHLTSGDINGDGLADFVSAHGGGSRFVIHLGKPGREFSPPQTLFNQGVLYNPRLVDWDSDGHLDLVFLLDHALVVRLGDGAGGFGADTNLGVPDLRSFELLGGEGGGAAAISRSERLLVRSVGGGTRQLKAPPLPKMAMITARPGEAAGFFVWVNSTFGSAWHHTPGDAHESSLIGVGYQQRSDGSFSRCRAGATTVGSVGAFETADLDADGTLDFIYLQTGGYMTSRYWVGYGE